MQKFSQSLTLVTFITFVTVIFCIHSQYAGLLQIKLSPSEFQIIVDGRRSIDDHAPPSLE
jgi:hypothetical protein